MNVFVKPREIDGQPALIRDPQTGKPLAAAGEWKEKTQFWIRRIMQGDVIDASKERLEAQAAAAEAPAAPAAAPTEPAPSLAPSPIPPPSPEPAPAKKR